MAQVENHNNFGTFKIEMVPEFNGKCDVANFIRDVNHIFDIHKPCEQLKVISLQNCIKGHALNAYHLTGGNLTRLTNCLNGLRIALAHTRTVRLRNIVD